MNSLNSGDNDGRSNNDEKICNRLTWIKTIFGEDSYYPSCFTSEPKLRKDLYLVMSNTGTRNIKQRCRDLHKQFVEYTINKVIPIDGMIKDLLHLVMINGGLRPWQPTYKKLDCELNYLIDRVVLCPELKLEGIDKDKYRSVANVTRSVGVQHVVLSSVPDLSDGSVSESLESSDSGDKLETEPKKKLRKVVQEAKNINVDSHISNFRRDPLILCQVDILILITLSNAAYVAKHLGLIYLEDVLDDVQNVTEYLLNTNAKCYKLAQTRITEKLMNGFSNIVVTSNISAWKNIRANVRAILTEENMLDVIYRKEMNEASDYVVLVDSFLSCVEAIGGIVSKALHFPVTTPVKYEVDGKKFATINVPITAIVPLYIIRYLTQYYMASNTAAELSLSKLLDC
uniref:Uncharacterized protein n=1 Tax=Photinus pyralis TaxID=7054 RepID=A0A1Y1M158_PHOPY